MSQFGEEDWIWTIAQGWAIKDLFLTLKQVLFLLFGGCSKVVKVTSK